jgi:hypothetical protein
VGSEGILKVKEEVKEEVPLVSIPLTQANLEGTKIEPVVASSIQGTEPTLSPTEPLAPKAEEVVSPPPPPATTTTTSTSVSGLDSANVEPLTNQESLPLEVKSETPVTEESVEKGGETTTPSLEVAPAVSTDYQQPVEQEGAEEKT